MMILSLSLYIYIYILMVVTEMHLEHDFLRIIEFVTLDVDVTQWPLHAHYEVGCMLPSLT